MITKEIRLDIKDADEMIDSITDYEKKYIIEDTKYYEEDNFLYVIFGHQFDFDRIYPLLLKLNIDFTRIKYE